MQELLLPGPANSVARIIVEMIGPDGLVHHVGPFKSRAQAEAWIAQTLPKNVSRQDNASRQDDVVEAPTISTI